MRAISTRKPEKRQRPKTKLALPDLDHSRSAVLNGLRSPESKRGYRHAIDEFIEWYCSEPRLSFNRIVVTRYRIHLEDRHLAPGTINGRLAAVRRLAYEAADAGLLSPELAAWEGRSHLPRGACAGLAGAMQIVGVVCTETCPRTKTPERRPPQWIESAQELLRSRLKNPPDLLETARIAGVHPSHLSRAFRQFTGMTVGAYLRRERVHFACSLLHQSQYSLAEIAQEAGFYDQAHFSRVFRRQVGLSPKEFRSLHRTQ